MSDFHFSCPSCGQSIVSDTSNAGMQIPCPICQTQLTIPKPPPAAPAAPVPPTGNKLSINKAAHQAHSAPPPPGAASAPAQPAWGTKPAPPARPKKKVPWVPIGVTVGILAAAAIGWFAFGAPYLKQQEEKKKQAEEAARIQAEEQAKAAAEAAKAKAKPTWKMDLANTQFPSRVATGKNHGVDFTVENALFHNGSLALIQASGSPHQFVITLPLKTGETVAGKSWQVTATDTNTTGQPKIVLGWKDDNAKVPGVASFNKGFAMKLEFGAVADGKLPGKIYLCLPDPEQSFVAGTFEIGPKTPAGQPGAATSTPAAPTTGRRRGS